MDRFNNSERKNPFHVPEDYFENLTNRVMDKVEKQQKPQRLRFIQIIKPYMGLAAIFALALFMVQIVLPHVVDENKLIAKDKDAIAKADKQTEEVYFDSQFNPTEEEIIEYLSMDVNSYYDLVYADIY